MNDFTKEDLELLMEWSLSRHELTSGVQFCREGSLRLNAKIKSMIENYCDHGYLTFLEDDRQNTFIEKCIKCHKLRFQNNE